MMLSYYIQKQTVQSNVVYKDLYKDKYLFDLSNYPNNSKFFDPVNEKAIEKTCTLNKLLGYTK